MSKCGGSRESIMNTPWISIVLGILDEAHIDTDDKPTENISTPQTAKEQTAALSAIFGKK